MPRLVSAPSRSIRYRLPASRSTANESITFAAVTVPVTEPPTSTRPEVDVSAAKSVSASETPFAPRWITDSV